LSDLRLRVALGTMPQPPIANDNPNAKDGHRRGQFVPPQIAKDASMRRAVQLLRSVSVLWLVSGATQAQPEPLAVGSCYRLTHIWTMPEIVGYGTDGPQPSKGAFLWRKGEFIDLGARIGHANTSASAINDHGDVVGTYSDNGDESQAFLLRHRRLVDIEGVPGEGSTVAVDVNNRRQVLVSRNYSNAFIWERGRAAQLEALEPDDLAFPRRMNDHGIVVGVSADSSTDQFSAVLWQDGTVMGLGMPEGARAAVAVDVNNRGQVLVDVIMWPYVDRPFLWQEGEWLALPLLIDSPYVGVNDINDQGVVVGSTTGVSGSENPIGPTATVWRDGQVADLNTLICSGDPLRADVSLRNALRINDRGQIVAEGEDIPASSLGFYLLTPKR
jgi:hypothetical protein